MSGRFVRSLLPLGVLLVGAAGFFLLIWSEKGAQRRPRPDRTPLVEVVPVQPTTLRARVTAQGTVLPARQVTLSPEVSGRVAWVRKELVPGGLIPAGAELVRIDDRQYTLGVRQREADVARADVELALERSRGDVAGREWKQLSPARPDAADNALALREPQLRAAEAALASARAVLERARLDVARTRIVTPFAALVIEEAVEVGQVVSPQTRLATLVGAEAYWVEVAVPMTALALIDLPGGGGEGSAATVTLDAGERTSRWQGRVVRLLGDVDLAGRMARLIVEVTRPHEAGEGDGEGRVPLLLHAFVDVAIEGRERSSVYEVPRVALREGDRVWLADASDRLVVRTIQTAWRTPDSVVVHSGLSPGERLITSPVPGAVEGMPVRVAGALRRDEGGSGGGGPPAGGRPGASAAP